MRRAESPVPRIPEVPAALDQTGRTTPGRASWRRWSARRTAAGASAVGRSRTTWSAVASLDATVRSALRHREVARVFPPSNKVPTLVPSSSPDPHDPALGTSMPAGASCARSCRGFRHRPRGVGRSPPYERAPTETADFRRPSYAGTRPEPRPAPGGPGLGRLASGRDGLRGVPVSRDRPAGPACAPSGAIGRARRHSVNSVLSTRRPSWTARRLDSPNIRSFSTEGTSVIATPAAAKRQLMTVSISKPSPHIILPLAGAGALWSGRSSSGIRSAQNAL